MNKNRIIILFSVMFIFNNAFSQSEKYYYFYTQEQIEENIKRNSLEVCDFVYFNEFENTFQIGEITAFETFSGDPLVLQLMYSGGFMYMFYDHNFITCYDIEQCITFKFKKIDNYTLETMDDIGICNKGTKLYLHYQDDGEGREYRAFYEPNDLITSEYWKTGVKNGIHDRSDNDTIRILYYYQNNILIDSIALYYSQYHSNPENIVKELLFIEKYGNAHNISKYSNNDLKLISGAYYYVLMKGENVISAGEFDEYKDSAGRVFADYRDINGTYEFTLSKEDDVLVVRSFESTDPDAKIILNVEDTLRISP